LDFWATWCAPCVAEFPNVRKVQEEYGTDGDFMVVGISLDSEDEKVAAFVKKHKIAWPQIVAGPAERNPLAKKFFVEGIPATFLIDRNGKVVAKDLRGPALRKEVDRLMRAAHPPKETAEDSAARAAKGRIDDSDLTDDRP
jgi:thiol-disulfide isomerase/thioredoxin